MQGLADSHWSRHQFRFHFLWRQPRKSLQYALKDNDEKFEMQGAMILHTNVYHALHMCCILGQDIIREKERVSHRAARHGERSADHNDKRELCRAIWGRMSPEPDPSGLATSCQEDTGTAAVVGGRPGTAGCRHQQQAWLILHVGNDSARLLRLSIQSIQCNSSFPKLPLLSTRASVKGRNSHSASHGGSLWVFPLLLSSRIQCQI